MPALPQQPDAQQQPSPILGGQATPPPTAGQVAAQAPTSQLAPQYTNDLPLDWEASLPAIAKRHGVDPELLRRVIKAESAGDPNAADYKTGTHKGLMQISPALAKQYGVDPLDPLQNIGVGAAELARLLKKYNGHYGRAVAAYNAGEGRIDAAGGAIPQNGETPDYVLRVLEGYQPPQVEKPKPVQPQQPQQGIPWMQVLSGQPGASQSVWDAVKKSVTAPGTLFGGPTAEQQAQSQLPTQGQVDLQNQQVQQGLQNMQQHPFRSFLHMINPFGGDITPGGIAQHSAILPQAPLIDPHQITQAKGPFGQGVEAAIGGLTSPESVTQLLTLPQGQVMQLYYTGQMGADTAQSILQAQQQYQAGDIEGAKRTLGEAVVSGTMTGMVGSHVARDFRTEAVPSTREVKAETPSTIPGQPPRTQVTAQAAPSQAQEGAIRPATAAGVTGAREVAGAQPRAAGSAPIEGTGLAAGTGAPKPGITSQSDAQWAADFQREMGHPPTARDWQVHEETYGRTQQPRLGDRRQLAVKLPKEIERRTGEDRRTLTDIAKEQMVSTPPGVPTPGEQLEARMRAELPKPTVDEGAVFNYVTQKGILNPEWYQQWKTAYEAADSKTRGKMLVDIQKEIESAKRPTGRPEAPAPTPAAAGIQPVRAAEIPARPTREPVQPGAEPVPAAAGSVAKKPYTPLPPEQRPRVSAADIRARAEASAKAEPSVQPSVPQATAPEIKFETDSMGVRYAYDPARVNPEDQRPYRVSVPKRIPEAEVEKYASEKIDEQVREHGRILEARKPKPLEAARPGGPVPEPPAPGTPRPERASAEQLESWKETRRAEAAARESAMKAEAQYKPKIETRSPLGAALDRHLKPAGDYKGDRGAELVRAVQDVKAQGPEAVRKASEEMSNRAARAQAMAAWGQAHLEGREADAEATERLHAGSMREREVPDALGMWAESKGFKWTQHPQWRREISSSKAEVLNRVRGNKLREVGDPRELTPEEETQLKTWENARDEIVSSLRRQNKPTDRALEQLEKLVVGIQSLKGTRFIAEGGPETRIGEKGELLPTGTRTSAQQLNRFMNRPETGHVRKPSTEEIQARVREYEKEAKWAGDIARDLGASGETAKPSTKPETKPATTQEAPPPRATAPTATPTATTGLPMSEVERIAELKAKERVGTAQERKEAEKILHKPHLVEKETAKPVEEAVKPAEEPVKRTPAQPVPISRHSSVHGREAKARPREARPATEVPKAGPVAGKQKEITEAFNTGGVKALEDFTRAELLHAKEWVGANTKAGIEEALRAREGETAEVSKLVAPMQPLEKAKGWTPELKRPELEDEGFMDKGSMAMRQLSEIGDGIHRLPEGEDKTALIQRSNALVTKMEDLNERIRLTSRNIAKMREAGETERTYTRKSDGVKVTETLQQLEMRRMLLGQERAKVAEDIPSLKDSVRAIGKAPLPAAPKPTETKAEPTKVPVYGQRERVLSPETGKPAGYEAKKIGEKTVTPSPAPVEEGVQGRIEELQAQRRHLANLINKGYGDSRKALDLKKSIKKIESMLGHRTPEAPADVSATLAGAGLLRAARASQPREGGTVTLGKAVPVELPTDHAADLHELLTSSQDISYSTPLMDKVLTPNEKGKRILGDVEGNSLAKPVLDAFKEGDLTASEAGKRFTRALETLFQGRQKAGKLPPEERSSAMAKAFSDAIEIAKGRRLQLPSLKEGGFIGKPGGKGMEAARRIREEREREEKGPFYNMSERVVREQMPSSAKPDDVMGLLRNAGVSKNEMKWNDLDTFLMKARKEGRQVTKKEVSDYLKERNPKIEVTEKTKATVDREATPRQRELYEDVMREFNEHREETKRMIRDTLGVSDAKAQSVIDGSAAIGTDSPEGRGEFLNYLRGMKPDISLEEHQAIMDRIDDYYRLGERLDDVRDQLDNIEHGFAPGGPQYESYTLPGGENYREVLLRMPAEGEHPTDPDRQAGYTSPHFDESNIVAHLRLKDRVDADGKKTLFIEEVQSDWARQLREQEKYDRLDTEDLTAPDMRLEAGTPKMPFTEGHWLELSMKYALKEAAEKGYDRIAWTTGEQQVKRYPGLERRFDRIQYDWNAENGTYGIVGESTHGRHEAIGVFDSKELERVLGKEVADKVISSAKKESSGELIGQDITLGGEHHRALYDKMIPQFVEKYGKKWGAKVEKADVRTSEKFLDPSDAQVKEFMQEKGLKSVSDFAEYSATHMKEIDAWREKLGLGTKFDTAGVHSMDIPAGMRETLKKPLRMIGGSQAGVVQFKGRIDERVRKAREAGGKADTFRAHLGRVKDVSQAFVDWYKHPERGQKLSEALKGQKPQLAFKEALGGYSEARQQAKYALHGLIDSIKKQVPAPEIREAITNYVQAGGDTDLLEQRAQEHTNKKLAIGYENAGKLSPAEIQMAKAIQGRFDYLLQEGRKMGVLEHGLENYITQIWDRDTAAARGLLSDVQTGKFQTNFKYARQRLIDSYFEGEMQGKTPKNKDAAFLLATYENSMQEAIAARKFVKDMFNASAPDGRPLIVPENRYARAIRGPEGDVQSYTIPLHGKGRGRLLDADLAQQLGIKIDPKTLTENEKVRTETGDYKSINHPAFRKWAFSMEGPDGKPVLVQSDARVHPDIARHLENIYTHSWFRQFAPTRWFMQGQAVLKNVLLGFPGFHYVQEGLHASFHGVNPLHSDLVSGKRLQEAMQDETVSELMRNGLMLYDNDAVKSFGEGLAGLSKMPVIGKHIQGMQDHLFKTYVPGLKATLAKKAFSRNLNRYSDYVDAGEVTRQQLAEISAAQANAAFGELNYDWMGRSKTAQDLFRIFALAPDFLEARARFVGQAARPYGREQFVALAVRAGIMQWMIARTLNMAFNQGNPMLDKDHIFSVKAGDRDWSLRTIAGDITHLIKDPTGFMLYRMSPAFRLGAAAFSKYFRGKGLPFSDVVSTGVPIPIQGAVRELFKKGQGNQEYLNSLLESIGVQSKKFMSQKDRELMEDREARRLMYLRGEKPEGTGLGRMPRMPRVK